MTVTHEKKVTDRSKALIALFWMTAAYVAFATSWHFGVWWLVVIPVGMLSVSLLGGILFVIGYQADQRGILFVSTLLDVGQLILAVLGSYYALRQVHYWIG